MIKKLRAEECIDDPITDRKKLLVYAHYYIPDIAATGQILSELCEGILDKFDVTVICVVPSYTGIIEEKYKTKKYYIECQNGVNILRIRVPEFCKSDKRSRIMNILAYFFGAIWATFRVGKMDFVLSISQPPILGGLLGVWGKWINRLRGRHTNFIYNIQDLNPEQIMAVHYNKNKLVIRTLMSLDKFSCRQSSLIITVGRDLMESVEARFKGKKVPKTILINNWIDESSIYRVETDDPKLIAFKKKYDLEDKFVIMYSGNIGLYYDLENIIKVIEKFGSGTRTKSGQEVVFAFVGSGAVLETLQSYQAEHQMDNVCFIPYQEKCDMIYSLNAGNVHLVVSAKGIKGVSCSSKYYSCAAIAAPILGVLEEGSEIRSIIDETKSGLCCEPGDYESIERNIRWFLENDDSDEIAQMGIRGRTNLIRNLRSETAIRSYASEILKTAVPIIGVGGEASENS
jgi:glycosyltransferase involved in cell wall biosynthesis